MKNITFMLIGVINLFAQDHNKLFSPNTNYLERGIYELSSYKNNSEIDNSYQKYNAIYWRTLAIDPTKILPGSIVFIPELAGYKLADGSYHDGYFLAHMVLDNYPSSQIRIFIDEKFSKINVTVYKVQGTMEKAVRARFKKQYEKNDDLKTYEMVSSNFTKLMQEGNKTYKNISERLQYYSEKGIGTPYLIFNLGEGADSYVDPDPTIDFARTDCMTFCEHTLALAISDNYSNMYHNLQKIRYNKGQIGYITRNHYTLVDWLPNNNWLLEDVTREVGAGTTKTITKEIDRPAFYKNNGVSESELKNAPGKTKISIDYIPTGELSGIVHNLKGGEVFSIITKHPAVFSAHMGIVIKDSWGNTILRHASSLQETHEVTDERFLDYIDHLKKSKNRIGMVFIRAREDFKIPD